MIPTERNAAHCVIRLSCTRVQRRRTCERATFLFVQVEDETVSEVRTWGPQHAVLWAELAAAGCAVEVVVVGRDPVRLAAAGRVLDSWAAPPCTLLNDFARLVSWSWAVRREPPSAPCVLSTWGGHVPRRSATDGCPVGSLRRGAPVQGPADIVGGPVDRQKGRFD